MIIALDTNVLIDLWANTVRGQANAVTLAALQTRGATLVICGAVYAELLAYHGMTRTQLDTDLNALDVHVDPVMDLPIWAEAGRAHAAIAARRLRAKHTLLRRPLADHLIGAHALRRADVLMTFNKQDFSDFPGLTVI